MLRAFVYLSSQLLNILVYKIKCLFLWRQPAALITKQDNSKAV